MELEITKLDEKAIIPSVECGIADLSVFDLVTEVGRDGRLILIYRTGISIKIPMGYVGILIPTKLSPIYSLDDSAGMQVLSPGYDGEIIGRYKINTNSVPAIFEKGELFARLIITPISEITFSVLTKSEEEVNVDGEDAGDNGVHE